MDFFGGFSKTKSGNNYLFIVVDRFSKMVILIPCKKIVTEEGAAKLFFQNVWKYFGLPTSIISDRDSREVLMRNDGYEVKAQYYFSSIERWTNRGC